VKSEFKEIRSYNNVPIIELCYPRIEGNAKELEIELMDTRAADNIRISYDFDRDGWTIKQASIFEWEVDDTPHNSDWQEVAFIKAWGRECEKLSEKKQ